MPSYALSIRRVSVVTLISLAAYGGGCADSVEDAMPPDDASGDAGVGRSDAGTNDRDAGDPDPPDAGGDHEPDAGDAGDGSDAGDAGDAGDEGDAGDAGSACVQPSDCPGADDFCAVRTCEGGLCGWDYTAAGSDVDAQTAGDCRTVVCDGAGGTTSVVDDADLPDLGECAVGTCNAGAPGQTPLAEGTACGAGDQCDGAGSCGPASLYVVVVGSGEAALTNAATPVTLERRALDGASLGDVSMPTVAAGANEPFTLSGTATSEGLLSLSADGRFLVLGGYAAVPGTAQVASSTSAAVNRVIARVDAQGTVDTSTTLPAAFSGNNLRSAASTNGTDLWAAGGTSGAQYAVFGASASLQVVGTPSNIRALAVFGGQLYGSSGSSTYRNVFKLGDGTPTAAGGAATSFSGMPTANASPYEFALLDRDPMVAGPDTLYVADERATASGGGLQKWTFDGATWTLAKTFTNALGSSGGARGVAAVVRGANVALFVTTPSALVKFEDGSGDDAGTVLASAPTNKAFRGVAVAPR